MTLTVKNGLLNLGYYAVTVVALPAICLRANVLWGLTTHPRGWILGIASAIFATAGAGLQLWCIVLFQRFGRGTPSPAVPPERLVTAGPYRYLRNPMNLGELMVFLGLSGWFRSPTLFLYAVAAAISFHVFVVAWEEPVHAEKFGEDYSRYRKSVRRWIPRFPLIER